MVSKMPISGSRPRTETSSRPQTRTLSQGGDTTRHSGSFMLFIGTQKRYWQVVYVFAGYGGTSFGPVCQAVEVGHSLLLKQRFSLLWTALVPDAWRAPSSKQLARPLISRIYGVDGSRKSPGPQLLPGSANRVSLCKSCFHRDLNWGQ